MSFLGKIKYYYVNFISPSNENKRRYLIAKGATIGEGTRFNCKTTALGSEPYMVKIGKDCLFAANVNFITHDGGVKVLNSLHMFGGGVELDKVGPIVVGNNVYIGMGAYIMPNVNIGDNCIIGAGAVVTKNIPANSVAVGIPARVIEDIDTYYKNSKNSLENLNGMDYSEKKKYLKKRYIDMEKL